MKIKKNSIFFCFYFSGAGLQMRKLELKGKILAYFPMPNLEAKAALEAKWLKTCKLRTLDRDSRIILVFSLNALKFSRDIHVSLIFM